MPLSIPGPAGAQGVQGAQGTQGVAGPQGAAGVAATNVGGFTTLPPNPRSGILYPVPSQGAVGTLQILAGAIYFTPFQVYKTPVIPYRALNIEVTTLQATAVWAAAIYSINEDFMPGTPIITLGGASANVLGRNGWGITINSNSLLAPGMYYTAVWGQTTSGTAAATCRAITSQGGPIPYITAPSTNNWVGLVMTGQATAQNSAWPDTPTPTGNSAAPRLDFNCS